MRRTCLALLGIILISLMVPTNALALVDWLEHMSGPGAFFGWQFDARLWCFGDEDSKANQVRQYRVYLAGQLDKQAQSLLVVLRDLYVQRDLNTKLTANILSGGLSIGNSVAPSLPTFKDVSTWGQLRAWFVDLARDSSVLAAKREPSKASSKLLFQKLADLDSLRKGVSSSGGGTLSVFDIFGMAPDVMHPNLNDLVVQLSALTAAGMDFDSVAGLSMLGAFGGVTYSACAVEKDAARTGSVNLVYSNLHTKHPSDEFAGGHRINLVTLVPTVGFRPLRTVSEKLDYVDLAVGAGIYWFSDGEGSGTFNSFSGWVLEPIRFDFHFPQVLAKKHWILAAPSIRYGLTIFPAGIDQGAFGNSVTGAPSRRLPAEWLQSVALYFDISPILYSIKHPPESKTTTTKGGN